MTPGPNRSTPSGRAYLDLKNKARQEQRATQEYLQLYALEGFLNRLSASGLTEKLVLKGGVLLAAYALRRPTADVDLAARRQSNEVEEVRQMVVEVAKTPLPDGEDDGLQFEADSATAESIREGDAYSGVRVTMQATLATARLHFHVDVNVGDPIWPEPVPIGLPKLLGGEIELLGYPIAMVLAEKTVTAMQRGTASTRWRDFGDIYQLTRTHELSAAEVRASIERVATHRRLEPSAIGVILDGYGDIGQRAYRAWRVRSSLDDRLPEDFGELVEAACQFIDPLFAGSSVSDAARWDPNRRQWTGP